MAEPYRRQLIDIAARHLKAAGSEIECRHFFSGAALYAEGSIFATLTPVGLALKLPAERRAALMHEGGKPLRYFLKSPIKKGYSVLPEPMISNPECFASLLTESLGYCLEQKKARGA